MYGCHETFVLGLGCEYGVTRLWCHETCLELFIPSITAQYLPTDLLIFVNQKCTDETTRSKCNNGAKSRFIIFIVSGTLLYSLYLCIYNIEYIQTSYPPVWVIKVIRCKNPIPSIILHFLSHHLTPFFPTHQTYIE